MSERLRKLGSALLTVSLLAPGLVACTGQKSPVARPTSASPFPSPTPIAPATETRPSHGPFPEGTSVPTPLASRPPGTIPVYGTIRARILPLESLGDPNAAPPILTMAWIDPAVPGSELRQVAQKVATGDFRMVLSPFDLLVLSEVQITGGPVGFETTDLPTNGPGDNDPVVVVPDVPCVYVGRMTFTYIRLPDRDGLAQLALASELAQGRSLTILFTRAGTLVYLPDDPSAHRFDVLPSARRPHEARRCPVSRVGFRDLTP